MMLRTRLIEQGKIFPSPVLLLPGPTNDGTGIVDILPKVVDIDICKPYDRLDKWLYTGELIHLNPDAF